MKIALFLLAVVSGGGPVPADLSFMGGTLADHSYVNKLVVNYKTYIIIPYL